MEEVNQRLDQNERKRICGDTTEPPETADDPVEGRLETNDEGRVLDPFAGRSRIFKFTQNGRTFCFDATALVQFFNTVEFGEYKNPVTNRPLSVNKIRKLINIKGVRPSPKLYAVGKTTHNVIIAEKKNGLGFDYETHPEDLRDNLIVVSTEPTNPRDEPVKIYIPQAMKQHCTLLIFHHSVPVKVSVWRDGAQELAIVVIRGPKFDTAHKFYPWVFV